MKQCTICRKRATHMVTRKIAPEPLCDDHLLWLVRNTTREFQAVEIPQPLRDRSTLAAETKRLEQIAAYKRLRYQERRAEFIAMSQRYYEANRKKVLAQHRQYKESNKATILARAADYRARKSAERAKT